MVEPGPRRRWRSRRSRSCACRRASPCASFLGGRHLHDLGKMMFAFVMIWAYVNFSQYLIVWSGNLPEEIHWYLARFRGGWGALGLAILLFHFVLPFLLLLSREANRNPRLLAGRGGAARLHALPRRRVAGAAGLLGRRAFRIHWLDLTVPIGIGGIWVALLRAQPRRPAAAARARPRLRGGARAWTRITARPTPTAWPPSPTASRTSVGRRPRLVLAGSSRGRGLRHARRLPALREPRRDEGSGLDRRGRPRAPRGRRAAEASTAGQARASTGRTSAPPRIDRLSSYGWMDRSVGHRAPADRARHGARGRAGRAARSSTAPVAVPPAAPAGVKK